MRTHLLDLGSPGVQGGLIAILNAILVTSTFTLLHAGILHEPGGFRRAQPCLLSGHKHSSTVHRPGLASSILHFSAPFPLRSPDKAQLSLSWGPGGAITLWTWQHWE
jgi:hypothetical protein